MLSPNTCGEFWWVRKTSEKGMSIGNCVLVCKMRSPCADSYALAYQVTGPEKKKWNILVVTNGAQTSSTGLVVLIPDTG